MPESQPAAPGFSDSPGEDQVGLAARALGSAVSLAIGWLGVVTWGTTRLRAGQAATSIEQVDPGAAYVNFLVYGLVLGLAASGLLAWWLLAPVASSWRRWGITMVAVFTGVSAGMGVTWLVGGMGGETALLGVAAVGLLGAVLLGRAARSAT